MIDPVHPPLLTPDLSGIGGRLKVEPEDFEVEEIPAYQPSGEGDFLYLWIEKRDLGAEFFTREVSRRLDIPAGEIGSAGLKDRRAVTRQMISIPAQAEANIPRIDGDGIRVLSVGRHSNKLKAGHLHGNRFRIVVRDVNPAIDATPILERLRREGVPNFYGTQRFGRDGETLTIGQQLMRGEPTRKPIRSPFLKKLALSAVQSALFNDYLGQRLQDGIFRRVIPGDVMAKIPFGGMFTTEDPVTEQQRFDAREIVTAGPIFGKKTFPSKADAAAREDEVLKASGMTRDAFRGFGKLMMGTRRHNLYYVDDLHAEPTPVGLRLTFTLPAGCYATVLLRELMKADVGEIEAE